MLTYLLTLVIFFAILYSGLGSISNTSDLTYVAIGMLIIGALLWLSQRIILLILEKLWFILFSVKINVKKWWGIGGEMSVWGYQATKRIFIKTTSRENIN